MTTRFTDDEIVALALASRRPWQAILPTVRLDADALGLAAGRGATSLAARKPDSPELERAAERVTSVAGQLPLVMLYAASKATPSTAAGPVASVFAVPAADDYLLDLVAPIGLHEIHQVDQAGINGWLGTAVGNVWANGPDGTGDGDQIFVIIERPGTDAPDVTVIDGQSVRGATLDSSEAGVTVVLGDPVSDTSPLIQI